MVFVLCLVLLSACGSSSDNAASSGSSEGGSSDPSSKPVTLTMMVSGTKAANGEDFILDTLPKLVKEKFPNVTLETSKLPDDQYVTSIRTKLAAGQGPDMFLVFPRYSTLGVIDMAKAGYAADLSGLSFWDNISPGTKEDMSYEGKPYAVSEGISFLGVYYNKELFEKAGITSLPTDWESFLAACQKLKDAGITPIVMGDKDSWYIQFGMYQIAANVVYPGEMDFDSKLQAGERSLTDPKWVKTISMYKELYDKGYIVKNSLGIGGAQAAQLFVDGKAAMTFDGTWNYLALTAKGATDFTRGFFPLPANEPGNPTFISAATSAGYAINANSKNIDIAKQIMEYWFDGKSPLFKAWVESSTTISAYKGVPLNKKLFEDTNKAYQESGRSVYFPNQMWPGGVAEQMEAKFSEIIGGKKTTPEDVANAMDAKFKELWKSN
jgi:raffinose/stachyose/melibiose transport system substrate-binding protein